MRKLNLIALQSFTVVALIGMTGCGDETSEETSMDVQQAIEPPVCEKNPKELTIHGHTRVDNYYWLNDREDPKVIEYLNQENAYTKAKLKHTEELQEQLYNEIVGRIKQNDESVPFKKNGYFYYTRFEEGGEYAIHCRKEGTLEGAEEVMLDENELAKGHAYYATSGVNVSPDNKIAAFGEDTVSRRKYSIRFKNLETGEMYPDKISETTGSVAWANDNKTVFYTRKDPVTLRSDKVYRHVLGTDPSEDAEIFFEADETFLTYVYRSKSGKYIIIGSYATVSSEFQILSADDPMGEFKVFQPRERDLEYSISHFGDKFYVTTNMDAKNFRLMETPTNATTKESWKEVIAHRDDVLLEGIEVFNNFLVVEERAKGLNQLRVMPVDGEEHYLDFGEETYSAWTSVNLDFDTEILRYGYSSLTTPRSTFDYNMVSKEKTLLKQQEVVGGYNADEYEAKRLYAPARDGESVPISLVYKKGIQLDGNNPTLLYAYGSYGSTIDPGFSSTRLSLLDRGFVFAIAHIRGGEDLGRRWYEDGKMLNKKNTFYDFIDCGKHLVAEGYTNPDKLCAQGGSAGGLLMGAIINMAPEQWKAVIAAVPFVDVVTTMLDESIPLTTGEFDEWGNPKDSVYYHYILSYSPYDQVEAKDYPALLVTTGLHDSQVQYWEPAKWVAKLRELKTDNNTLLLECNMETGHGGASGRFKRYRETAMEYAFLLNELGMVQ